MRVDDERAPLAAGAASLDVTREPVAGEDPDEFRRLYEESLKDIQEGEVVKGTVIKVNPDHVIVDVGYKSEGQIPIEEFRGPDGQITVKEGDVVEVLLEKRENENGLVVLSKDKADKLKVWDEISKACEEEEVVEGKIIQRVKGGLAVDIGVKAFLPGSQVDLRPIRNLDKLIGKTFKFKVIKFNKKRGNIVLSRRVLLEKEREEQKARTLATLQEGMIVEGQVKNITDYGAFIDLGGLDGLLHITDMSWGRISHPTEVLQVGDTVKVKVLKFDRTTERVSLGLKQTLPDPWEQVAAKYRPGDRVRGKVVSITDYGAFVELEKGVEGLVHVSEMSWSKKVKHPSKIVSVGDTVEVQVLDVDPVNKRISLGLKQTEPNPWTLIEQKYPVGSIIEGQIRNVTDFGLFVGLDDGIDGLVHVSDISWTQKIRHPGDLYKKGQVVRAVVLNIDKENERISLGIKQLERDPWEEIPNRYKVGTRVTGRVTSVTDFGVFLELEPGIEGLIHVSELAREKVDDPQKVAKVGDTLSAEVIHVDRRERKIGLSVRQLLVSEEEGDYREYLRNQETAAVNLGDVVGGQLPRRGKGKRGEDE
ncbi:MAG TPA: 30S ribosomal protein S1 [Thermodesulfobacteriota bacterium]|nr:30S ribosomal protein S1 [Thermodesulfobacteriota bacterium]